MLYTTTHPIFYYPIFYYSPPPVSPAEIDTTSAIYGSEIGPGPGNLVTHTIYAVIMGIAYFYRVHLWSPTQRRHRMERDAVQQQVSRYSVRHNEYLKTKAHQFVPGNYCECSNCAFRILWCTARWTATSGVEIGPWGQADHCQSRQCGSFLSPSMIDDSGSAHVPECRSLECRRPRSLKILRMVVLQRLAAGLARPNPHPLRIRVVGAVRRRGRHCVRSIRRRWAAVAAGGRWAQRPADGPAFSLQLARGTPRRSRVAGKSRPRSWLDVGLPLPVSFQMLWLPHAAAAPVKFRSTRCKGANTERRHAYSRSCLAWNGKFRLEIVRLVGGANLHNKG